jgi:hypothetical protein
LIQAWGGAPATTAAPAAATEAPLPTGKDLTLWWWGEQEAPGLEGWVNDMVAKFKTETGNTICPSCGSPNNVTLSECSAASQAV